MSKKMAIQEERSQAELPVKWITSGREMSLRHGKEYVFTLLHNPQSHFHTVLNNSERESEFLTLYFENNFSEINFVGRKMAGPIEKGTLEINGRAMLKKPVLVRSPKLSKFEYDQYLDR